MGNELMGNETNGAARERVAKRTAALARRAHVGAWWGLAARWTAVALFVAGAALVLDRVRHGGTSSLAPLLFGLAGVPAIVAWFVAKRDVPSARSLETWLDVHADASGRVLTAVERDDPRWSSSAERSLAVSQPLPSVRWSHAARPLIPAALFAVAALFVPIDPPVIGPPTTVQERLVEELREKLVTLEEIVELEETDAEELRERLDSLEQTLDDAQPEAVFEASDRLDEQLDALAREAVEAAAEARDALTASEAFASAGEATPRDAQRAAEELAAASEMLAKSGLSLPLEQLSSLGDMLQAAGIPEELLNGLEGLEGLDMSALNGLTAEQLAKLAEAAKSMRGDLREAVGKLCEGGMCSGGDLEGFGEAESLDAILARAEKDAELRAALGRAATGTPGRGGVSRGRADAELTFGDDVGADDRFDPELLPAARFGDDASQLLGVGSAAPSVDGSGEAVGVESFDASAGKAAWRRRLSPRHRDAVESFFTRDA